MPSLQSVPLVFGLEDSHGMATQLAACAEAELAAIELRDFAGGEFKVRPLVDPLDRDVYVVAGLYGDSRRSPQDRLLMLLFLVAALRDHGASRITVLAPWLPFARKDRRTQPHDPISLRYAAELLEHAGVHHLITLEPHNEAAFDNAFRIPVTRIPAHRVLLAAALDAAGEGALVIASPDPGGAGRAQLWREAMERRTGRPVRVAMLDKQRRANAIEESFTVYGDVRETTVLLVNDLIATGTTAARASRALLCAGAAKVIVAAAHGQFLERAADLLEAAGIDALLLTDSLPSARLAGHRLRERLTLVGVAPELAALIRQPEARAIARSACQRPLVPDPMAIVS